MIDMERCVELRRAAMDDLPGIYRKLVEEQRIDERRRGLDSVTPLYVEIALHYCCRVGPFPRLNASACIQAVGDLTERGLLEWSEEDQVHRASEGLQLWLTRLCNTPFPERSWGWPKGERGDA